LFGLKIAWLSLDAPVVLGGIGQFFPVWEYRSKLSNHAKFTLDRDGSGLLPSSDRLLLTYFAYCSASVRHSDGYSSSIVHVN